MLAIRLRRTGAKRDAHYRVVVTERSAGRDGRFLEILGHYHPRRQPMEVVMDVARADAWVGKGAQMSDTVRRLYQIVKSGAVVDVPAAAPAVVEETTEAPLPVAAEAEAAEDGAGGAEAEAESGPDDGGEEE